MRLGYQQIKGRGGRSVLKSRTGAGLYNTSLLLESLTRVTHDAILTTDDNMSRFSPNFLEPSLPPLCEPENQFLYHISATLHTCVPTNLALISTLLGACSILSWLFAQLPQIYKNYTLKSTSGLSVFFLTEWLLGDASNFLGCIFTSQALWQILLGGYYCSVDIVLVSQWVWYARLGHGRPLRSARDTHSHKRSSSNNDDDSFSRSDGITEVLDGISVGSSTPGSERPRSSSDKKDGYGYGGGGARNPLDVPLPHRSNPMDVFRIPNFARSPASPRDELARSIASSSSAPFSAPSSTPPPGAAPHRTIHRVARGNSPMPSPKTLLYISLLLAIAAQHTAAASLHPVPAPHPADPTPALSLGTILSWLSTLLYLGSRLPQLYKNHRRRSTAGLSATLFAAAFFGNLFYASSLLANPCAWADFAPGEGRGWVGEEGSRRADWVARALPFWLGAAGVLVMDAAVGVQFLVFGEGEAGPEGGKRRRETVVVVGRGEGRVGEMGADGRRRGWRWHRASGWMRGWVPSVSVAGTPRGVSPARSARGDEGRALLGAERGGYGGV